MTEHCQYCGDDLTCAQCDPNEYVENLQFALSKAQSLARERMLALESLTPGGSEFVGDVKMCVDFIRDTKQRQHDFMKKQRLDNNKLKELLSQALTLIESVNTWAKEKRAEEHELPHTPEFMTAVKQVEIILGRRGKDDESQGR